MLISQSNLKKGTKMKRKFKWVLLPGILLSLSHLAFAGTYTINFEQYPEYTQITNQYASVGVTFENALQLVAPGYDYVDFPPTSGNGVITNDPNDPIQVNFLGPVFGVTGWYVDPNGITVTAYDGSNNVLDSFSGGVAYQADLEFSVASGTPIAYITISDDTGSPDTETVDDLSYTVAPEPGSFALFGTGLLGLAEVLRRKFARVTS
jgi:hypothetical protein